MTALADQDHVTLDQPAPGVIASEIAVLGGVIQGREKTETAWDILRTSQAFSQPLHQVIFEAAVSLAENGEEVDPAAVLGRIPRVVPERPLLSSDGVYLFDLIQRAGAVRYHARIVAADYHRRCLRLVAERLLQRTGPGTAGSYQAGEDARDEIDALAGAGEDSGVITAAELISTVMDDLEKPLPQESGVTTGLADLDGLVSSLRAGQLVIIAARPTFGKSVLGLNIIRQAAIRHGLPALLMSLEMSRDEVMHRVIAAEARVDLEAIERHDLRDADYERICEAMPRIASQQLVIDDWADSGLPRLRLRLRKMARTAPARVVVVDYLQLVTAGKAESRQQAVADLSRGLKKIAREFAVPIVVCAQLNRGPEQRSDKRPMASDLRESGAIEADADVIMLLHRPDHYDSSDRPGEMVVIVDKQRQGRRGEVTVGFQGEHGRCVDMTRLEPPWSPTSVLEER